MNEEKSFSNYSKYQCMSKLETTSAKRLNVLCSDLGRGAGEDRAEARRPVQVRTRLRQLQENIQVRQQSGVR